MCHSVSAWDRTWRVAVSVHTTPPAPPTTSVFPSGLTTAAFAPDSCAWTVRLESADDPLRLMWAVLFTSGCWVSITATVPGELLAAYRLLPSGLSAIDQWHWFRSAAKSVQVM